MDFKADVKVEFVKSRDLFSFGANFFVGENQVSLKQLQNYAKGKIDHIVCDDGKIVDIKNKEELDRFLEMLESFYQNSETGKFEGKLYSAFDLEKVLTGSEYYNAKFNAGFKKFRQEARDIKLIEKVKLKDNFKKILRDYQVEGVE